MKLFTRYSRINVISTIAIFLVASAAYYVTLNYVLIQQIDDDLRIEENEIRTYVAKHNHLPEVLSMKDQVIEFEQVPAAFSGRYFRSGKLNDSGGNQNERFRQLVFGQQVIGKWYRVTVSKSLEDTENLIHSVGLITLVTITAILLVAFLINRFVLKRIWRPFYRSLDAVRNFRVSRNQSLQFTPVAIDEFRVMNETLQRITSQAQTEYLSLKTFSENASHEIQTPLAIIRSKLDLLLQDENLTEQQGNTLQSAYNAIQKLTRLNQSLLLLAKIENKQFEETHPVDLKEKLMQKINDFQELWQSQQIEIKTQLKNGVVKMNEELSEILLNNLLSNATRHNHPQGIINIQLNEDYLEISNSSNGAELEEGKLFKRFYKSGGNENNGLGLSIIRQIADASGFRIDYSFKNGLHHFRVGWTV